MEIWKRNQFFQKSCGYNCCIVAALLRKTTENVITMKSVNNEVKNQKVSFVLSTYSHENPEYLDAAIKSMLDQSRSPDEIIIVLDGYVPESQHNIINKYQSSSEIIIKTVALEENKGRGEARNRGVEAASGDLVAIMDSDDLNYPGRLEKQLELMNRTDADIVAGWQSEFILDPFNVIAIKKCPRPYGTRLPSR